MVSQLVVSLCQNMQALSTSMYHTGSWCQQPACISLAYTRIAQASISCEYDCEPLCQTDLLSTIFLYYNQVNGMGEDLASSVEECENWCTYNCDCCVFEYILYEVGTFLQMVNIQIHSNQDYMYNNLHILHKECHPNHAQMELISSTL